ncbi:MAG: hypothetical protein ABIO79_09640 [Ferruginibacter sp.]
MRSFYLALLSLFASCTNMQKETRTQNDYYPTYTKNLESKIKTIELSYISWACACANWTDSKDYHKYLDSGRVSDIAIFIEPSDSSLKLPDTLGYSGDIIKFTGQFYKEKGYPKDYIKNEEEVDSARVFRYAKYEIIESNYRNFIDPKKE